MLIVSLKIMQANLNRSRTATDLLQEVVVSKRVDVALLSEPYIGRTRRSTARTSTDNAAAIWVPNRILTVEEEGCARCFVWVKISGTTIVSCYFSPNEDLDMYKQELDELGAFLMMRANNRVVGGGGGINAKALAWGHDVQDPRGDALEDWMPVLDLVLVNDTSAPTFVRGECRTILDLTLVSSRTVNRVQGRTTGEDIASDHLPLYYEIRRDRVVTDDRHGGCRYSFKGADMTRVAGKIDSVMGERETGSYEQLQEALESICAGTLKKPGVAKGREGCTGGRNRSGS